MGEMVADGTGVDVTVSVPVAVGVGEAEGVGMGVTVGEMVGVMVLVRKMVGVGDGVWVSVAGTNWAFTEKPEVLFCASVAKADTYCPKVAPPAGTDQFPEPSA